MDRHLLFFYGTLMSSHGRGNVLADRDTNIGRVDLAEPVARGTIRGDLYAVSAFPGLVEGDGVVHGEVWEAPTAAHFRAALSITDAIEGYRAPGDRHNMYERIEVPLLTVGASELGGAAGLKAGDTVLTYRWNFAVRGPIIPSGDWRDHDVSQAAWSRV